MESSPNQIRLGVGIGRGGCLGKRSCTDEAFIAETPYSWASTTIMGGFRWINVNYYH
jgi:hypothetical protein